MNSLAAGTAITVIDRGQHGPCSYRWGTDALLQAHVTEVTPNGFRWKSAALTGVARRADEGTTWIRGHDQQARVALLAQRALAERVTT